MNDSYSYLIHLQESLTNNFRGGDELARSYFHLIQFQGSLSNNSRAGEELAHIYFKKSIQKKLLDVLYLQSYYDHILDQKDIQELIFSELHRKHFLLTYRFAIFLSSQIEKIDFHSKEFQKISFLFQQCRFFNNEGSETFFEEFENIIRPLFLIESSNQFPNSFIKSEPYFCKIENPFTEYFFPMDFSFPDYDFLRNNSLHFLSSDFPYQYLAYVILPQFKSIPISTIRHSSVSEALNILKLDKHSEENKQKALEMFLHAANSGDIEACYFAAVMTVLRCFYFRFN